MSHAQELSQWTQRVQHLFPDLKPYHARNLAQHSFGVVLGPASSAKDQRLVLALDPTCHSDRFRVLAISVLNQG